MTPSSPPSYTFLDHPPSPLLNSVAAASTQEAHEQSNNTPTQHGPTHTEPPTTPQTNLPSSTAQPHNRGPPSPSQLQSPLPAHQNSPLPPLNFDPPNLNSNTNPVNEPPRTYPMITQSQLGIVKPIDCLSLNTFSISPIPKNSSHALQDPHWRNAMYDEYNALHKFHANGTLSCYKARLVANGSSQQLGVDFDETFSSVVKSAIICTVLSLAVSRQWSIHKLDVKNAFLNGDLFKTVYMHQPPGFVDSRYPYHGSQVAYLLIYVDDIILTTSSPDLLQQIIASLHNEGFVFFLRRSMLYSSFERAHMVNCNPSGHQLIQSPNWVRKRYAFICNVARAAPLLALQTYLATCSGGIWEFWATVVRFVWGYYLSGSVYIDADWSGCPSTRSSTSGYYVFLGDNLLSWSAKRQHTLSRSSVEVEYRGVANVVAETA
ncbi:ribonuclease H-like domain-containing protein [Tanacetum coccineum]